MEPLQVLDDPHDDDDHQSPIAAPPAVDYHSDVDTTRPFRSVKEAVAIFGERILVGDIYSPKPFTFPKQEAPFFSPSPKVLDKEPRSWHSSSPSPPGSSYGQDTTLSETVKKLEAELEETKAEIKLLKERESETAVALASLYAELHKSMSKLAQAEAAAALSRPADVEDAAMIIREEEKKRDAYLRMNESGPSPSLAQILSFGEKEGLFSGKRRQRNHKIMKKKPIVPLVGDLFPRKKGSSMHNPLYASSHLEWN